MSAFQPLRDYLDLHKRERRGLLFLIVLLGVSFLIMALIPRFVEPSITDREELESRMNRIMAVRDSLASEQIQEEDFYEVDQKYSKNKKRSKRKKELFMFNPNELDDEGWERLGLNSGQVRTINNYKSKGGTFRRAEDLEKMYSIPSHQYAELAPYISIPIDAENLEKNWVDFERKDSIDSREERALDTPLFIDINNADSSELVLLKGIGPYYAGKILVYREELGGFVHPNQLLEIWKFKQETLEQISSNIHLGTTQVKRININLCSMEELQAHPYISWGEAKALISYRDQHGRFVKVNQITNSHLISGELCQKIKPYLRID